MWAQTRFGSFRVDFASAFAAYPDREQALAAFHALDTLRLEAYMERELPGLWRDMQHLVALDEEDRGEDSGSSLDKGRLGGVFSRLQSPDATINDVLELIPDVLGLVLPQRIYQPRLNPEAVTACMLARMEREKILLRVKLSELAKELGFDSAQPAEEEETPPDLHDRCAAGI